ncbi:uncharacterized protein [Setaria viridis]|uniref:uncharacterized protein n=1 Tax=Setaria viridis TaxID=4556 RepID=UPI003B3B2209
MATYCNEVCKLEDKFDGLELNHVARRFNEAADELAKAASDRMPVPDGVFVSDQLKPSIRYPDRGGVGSVPPALDPSTDPRGINAAPPDPALEAKTSDPVVMEIAAGPAAGADPTPDWRTPYLDYLVHDALPADKTKARRIARRAKSFSIIDRELYKRSHTGILQRCIPIEQGKVLIQDIHAGACGHHAAPRTLVGNAFRQGFYWPTAVADATQVVRTCEGCQFFARQTHLPAQALQTIPITWPFAVLGLDLFTGKRFLQFCDDHHIRVDWAAVAHPCTNGQVERANGMILQGLKPRIFDRLKKFGGRWVAELPAVLWSLRTTPSRATGFTPFFMVYGSEAILPTDLEHGSPRVKAYDKQGNQASLEDAQDQLDEARDVALLHSAKYQQALRRYQSRRIQGRAFNVGDLVLRLVQDNRGRHKLTPPWEGPFIVVQVLRPGTYKLATPDSQIFSNAWNIEQLRRFYP